MEDAQHTQHIQYARKGIFRNLGWSHTKEEQHKKAKERHENTHKVINLLLSTYDTVYFASQLEWHSHSAKQISELLVYNAGRRGLEYSPDMQETISKVRNREGVYETRGEASEVLGAYFAFFDELFFF